MSYNFRDDFGDVLIMSNILNDEIKSMRDSVLIIFPIFSYSKWHVQFFVITHAMNNNFGH